MTVCGALQNAREDAKSKKARPRLLARESVGLRETYNSPSQKNENHVSNIRNIALLLI